MSPAESPASSSRDPIGWMLLLKSEEQSSSNRALAKKKEKTKKSKKASACHFKWCFQSVFAAFPCINLATLVIKSNHHKGAVLPDEAYVCIPFLLSLFKYQMERKFR